MKGWEGWGIFLWWPLLDFWPIWKFFTLNISSHDKDSRRHGEKDDEKPKYLVQGEAVALRLLGAAEEVPAVEARSVAKVGKQLLKTLLVPFLDKRNRIGTAGANPIKLFTL